MPTHAEFVKIMKQQHNLRNVVAGTDIQVWHFNSKMNHSMPNSTELYSEIFLHTDKTLCMQQLQLQPYQMNKKDARHYRFKWRSGSKCEGYIKS